MLMVGGAEPTDNTAAAHGARELKHRRCFQMIAVLLSISSSYTSVCRHHHRLLILLPPPAEARAATGRRAAIREVGAAVHRCRAGNALRSGRIAIVAALPLCRRPTAAVPQAGLCNRRRRPRLRHCGHKAAVVALGRREAAVRLCDDALRLGGGQRCGALWARRRPLPPQDVLILHRKLAGRYARLLAVGSEENV